ncbi:alpha/beta fold hydrolase [Streptomyces yaizuensis]|uniref:Alpha/beta hydrolase n=1 Tax=Streptomyces yaizuensis TaxID=2989713 RepID=A0ABQ5NY98_9ACTN|nr:alpha/beta hydrolase [Streptomyces sp. YSPA8]GLF94926.1 alpha/beta hydrolase [Streptomyces sp. YSPA8]
MSTNTSTSTSTNGSDGGSGGGAARTAAGAAIAHRTIGTGPHRVLVLHDWFATAAHWGSFLGLLDTDAFTYAFLDFRGYGDRKDVAGRYDVPEIADDALALADQLGWDGFSVVGLSMGGKVAQQVLAKAPGRVRRLAGIAPVPASPYPMDGATRDLFYGAATDPARRRAILDQVTGLRASGRWLDGMVRTSLEDSREEAFASYLASWQTLDLVDTLIGSELPVLVVAGEYDLALTPDLMRATWLAWYPNATLSVLSGAGHYPPQETPVALLTVLEDFLRG